MADRVVHLYELVRRLHLAVLTAREQGLHEADLVALLHPADCREVEEEAIELAFMIQKVGGDTNALSQIIGIPVEQRPLPDRGSVWLISRAQPDFIAMFKVPMKEVRMPKSK